VQVVVLANPFYVGIEIFIHSTPPPCSTKIQA